MPPALRIEALWKSYAAGVRGCSARIWVLRGLSLTIENGERVVIVGAPGAGKTTLATCILGLRRPDAGILDAPGVANGSLVVIGSGRWPAPPVPAGVRAETILVLTQEAAHIRSWADRALLLHAGELRPLDERVPVRQVAECALGQC